MNYRSFCPGISVRVFFRICSIALLLSSIQAFIPASISAQQKESIVIGTREREYYLHLPPNYNSTTELPLVIGMHGANQQAYEGENSFARMTGLDKKADAENFIVVYPVGIGSDILQVPTWNAGKCCLPASTSRMPDAEFVSSLIDELIVKRHIDKRRVYVMGFSNGGMMSFRLACELDGKIAAVVSHSGPYMYDGACSPTRPVPVLYMHGQQDSVVPYYGGSGRLSTSFSFTSADSTIKIWRGVIGCTEQEEVILTKPNASGKRWSNCRAGAEIQHYSATDGVHWWIGAPIGITSKAFVTTDIAWDFVKQYSLPQSTTGVEEQEISFSATMSPNPASDNVSLHLILPQRQPVSLLLKDILGNTVEEIYVGELREGSYDFSINTAQYATGMLFAQIQYGAIIQTYPLNILH